MDSVAKAEQIRAIATSRLVGYYGRLGSGQMLQIDEAIRVFDKLLLILSPDSMNSEWVKTEIAKAKKRELKEKR